MSDWQGHVTESQMLWATVEAGRLGRQSFGVSEVSEFRRDRRDRWEFQAVEAEVRDRWEPRRSRLCALWQKRWSC